MRRSRRDAFLPTVTQLQSSGRCALRPPAPHRTAPVAPRLPRPLGEHPEHPEWKTSQSAESFAATSAHDSAASAPATMMRLHDRCNSDAYGCFKTFTTSVEPLISAIQQSPPSPPLKPAVHARRQSHTEARTHTHLHMHTHALSHIRALAHTHTHARTHIRTHKIGRAHV